MDNNEGFVRDSILCCIRSIDNKDTHEQALQALKCLGKNQKYCTDYAQITRIIYGLNDKDYILVKKYFNVEYSRDNIFAADMAELNSKSILSKDDNENLYHFERHIKLSCYQRDSMAISKIKINEFEQRMSRIYSEFVGILGVFTALSFALMGSVQVFGNLLNNVENPNVRSIGYILVVAGVYLLLIYLVIMTLFIGMKKVFGQDKEYNFDKRFTKIFLITCGVLILLGLLGVFLG